MVKEVVRGLDTNDEEDWAADEVKVLQEDVEEQEHHARDANINCKLININWHLLFVSGLGQFLALLLS